MKAVLAARLGGFISVLIALALIRAMMLLAEIVIELHQEIGLYEGENDVTEQNREPLHELPKKEGT